MQIKVKGNGQECPSYTDRECRGQKKPKPDR